MIQPATIQAAKQGKLFTITGSDLPELAKALQGSKIECLKMKVTELSKEQVELLTQFFSSVHPSKSYSVVVANQPRNQEVNKMISELARLFEFEEWQAPLQQRQLIAL